MTHRISKDNIMENSLKKIDTMLVKTRKSLEEIKNENPEIFKDKIN